MCTVKPGQQVGTFRSDVFGLRRRPMSGLKPPTYKPTKNQATSNAIRPVAVLEIGMW